MQKATLYLESTYSALLDLKQITYSTYITHNVGISNLKEHKFRLNFKDATLYAAVETLLNQQHFFVHCTHCTHSLYSH